MLDALRLDPKFWLRFQIDLSLVQSKQNVVEQQQKMTYDKPILNQKPMEGKVQN
jgi:plasmid maintenance system antidote protein VapI